MFQFIGASVGRAWPVWLIGWPLLAAVLYLTAPPWDQVAQDREFGFLPEDAPSAQGQRLFQRAFPDEKQLSNIVIVASRANEELRPEDRTFIKEVIKPALVEVARKNGWGADGKSSDGGTEPIVLSIRTPDDAGAGGLLISEDRQAALVVMDLTTELLEQRNWPIVEEVEAAMTRCRSDGRLPNGLRLNLIGSATVGRDMTLGQRDSARATEFWSVVIVIVILVIIYRAPVAAMIPLLSVFMATQVSLRVLALLSQAGLVTLFDGVETYITVILYGTGVDYSLFLMARFREEREEGADWPEALVRAIGQIGPALLASAATVAFGIGMMVFARFGKFHFAGIALAIALAINLCVVLTFTTSLLRLAQSWTFWPHAVVPREESAGPSENSGSRIARWASWNAFGNLLVRQPALVWIITVLLMSPFAIGGMLHADDIDYDFIRRLPRSAPSVAGAKALEEHFPAGATGTITMLIYQPDLDFLVPDSIGELEIEGLAARIRRQLAPLQLADVRSQSVPLGNSRAAREAVGAPLQDALRGLEQAKKYYTSSTGDLKGHVTRMELTMLHNPMSRQGIASLDHMEETIRSELRGDLRNAKLYFLGVTADMRDLRQVTGSDQLRIQILVVFTVLAILILLLRRVVVSLYLVASVLFSYFATFGVTLLCFWWLDPSHFVGIDWKVPTFLFVILVAIGADYNIFLMTRVAEEQAKNGPIEGIRIALVKTAHIITSCGIIMAGTFASLLAGSMEDLHHLGFALAFGVLLDTFVVRPILVPTFLILLERGSLLWQKVYAVLDVKAGDKEKVAEHNEPQER